MDGRFRDFVLAIESRDDLLGMQLLYDAVIIMSRRSMARGGSQQHHGQQGH